MTRIAMWSGPRNISTAMMRAWDARPDTVVCDEPLYACYLARTGRDHPGAAEVIAHGRTDWRRVVRDLAGPVPGGLAIHYQKHMAHHLLPEIELDWLDDLRHAMLIRSPREMIVSLAKVIPAPTVEETGLPQQRRILDHLSARGAAAPPVIDVRDVLEDPPRLLRLLCDALAVPYTDAMLSWAPGPRPTDGVWARHWYHAVEQTTGFASYTPRDEPVPAHLAGVVAECDELYRELHGRRLGAEA